MKTTLVSFLGKNTADPKTGYRTATFRFADGRESSTPFFGLALAKELNPDFMVILGTAGSMWDAVRARGSAGLGGDHYPRMHTAQPEL